MVKEFFGLTNANDSEIHNEGELYKAVTTFGKSFELRYGFYEECDRENPLCEPVIIYPDFLKEPFYTDEGSPFVTMMQDACISYKGEYKKSLDSTCADCDFFLRGEELFGICNCRHRQRISD